MLDFANDYCKAVDSITANRDMKLCKFELDNSEWEVLVELCDTLKVCLGITMCQYFSVPHLFQLDSTGIHWNIPIRGFFIPV